MATVYPFQHLTNAGDGTPRHHDYSYSALHHLALSHTINLKPERQPEGLESRLIRFEATAREKCFAAIEGLPDFEMDGWFVRQLDSQIIPALRWSIQIGRRGSHCSVFPTCSLNQELMKNKELLWRRRWRS